jgi:hypothetical protein
MFIEADKNVEKRLQKMGFEVQFVDMNFRALSQSQVGLHCMTSVLARKKVETYNFIDESK